MHRVAVIGLGLIGGSLGLALRKAGWPVSGFSRRRETVSLAMALGAIDSGAQSPGEAAAGAEITVLATPIRAMPQVMVEIAPHLPPGAVVSDVASTKGQVMEWAQAHLPVGVSFIGGHPMAGRERQGLEAAGEGLFQGAVYCLVPSAAATLGAIELIKEMVELVGASPLLIEAREHDYLVAGISHLPLLLSLALTRAAAGDAAWPALGRLAATGFRDATRLASGSPEMGRDICLTNREAILSWLDRFSAGVAELRRMVAGGNEELAGVFAQAREIREQWLRAKGW